MDEITMNMDKIKENVYRGERYKFWQGFFLGVGIVSCVISSAYYVDKYSWRKENEKVYKKNTAESKIEIKSDNGVDRKVYFDEVREKEG